MRLGLYSFAALALMGIVAAMTYAINSSYYIVGIMGINLNFPIALWIVLPMFILFIFTLVHMLFYGVKNYFMLKKWQKDATTLEDALYWSLVGEPKQQKYATDTLGNSASLLSKASLNLSGVPEGLSPRLMRIIQMIQKIKNGEYVDLKEEKMTKVFQAENPIVIQNKLNRLDTDGKFVEEVLKSASDYPLEIRTKALTLFATTQNFEKAHKYVKVFDKDHFFMMLERVNPENRLELSTQILREFVASLTLQCEDFVQIALVCKKYFNPDECLSLFKSFCADNTTAESAYLYLLFEYELLDQVAIFLDEQGEDEFLKFRVLHELRKEHHKYKLEELIDIRAVCN